MKMVLAIINYDDSQDVISSLMKAGFSITKLATTGDCTANSADGVRKMIFTLESY